MSIVIADEIRRLDASFSRALPDAEFLSTTTRDEKVTSAISSIETILKSVQWQSSSTSLHDQRSLVSLIDQTRQVLSTAPPQIYEDEASAALLWTFIVKATLQTLGHVTNALVETIGPLNDDLVYWDDVLDSHLYTCLYMVQTCPWRVWNSSGAAVKRLRSTQWNTTLIHQTQLLPSHCQRLYRTLGRDVRNRSFWLKLKTMLLGPYLKERNDITGKIHDLKKNLNLNASCVGIVLMHGAKFAGQLSASDTKSLNHKGFVQSTIRLMNSLLDRETDIASQLELVGNYEASLEASAVDNKQPEDPIAVLNHLTSTITNTVPNYRLWAQNKLATCPRSSIMTRYWLPATGILLSSKAILQFISANRIEILTGIREAGQTVVDFWANWVVEPIRKLLGIIRHDEISDIALMSKASLEADQASLERMVIDFAVDHRSSGGKQPSSAEIESLSHKVREGDLTEVLRAYERDLRSPFVGTLRGDLVRALLIQIQKTKVDVEVAISGINALLTSQELVFGFIGLTPGVLVTIATVNWLRGVFGGKKILKRGKMQKLIRGTLRDMDRVLNSASASSQETISPHDYGALVCHGEVLCQRLRPVLPARRYQEFREDISDLLNIQGGISRQRRVLQRIRWVYAGLDSK